MVFTYTVVVNDLGDDGELAGRRTVVDENDAADLDVTLESSILGHDYLIRIQRVQLESVERFAWRDGRLLCWYGKCGMIELEELKCLISNLTQFSYTDSVSTYFFISLIPLQCS